jgi:DNA-binding IclR family transcriptional regulator
MAKAHDPNKAKTARRVIEVLEFFNEDNRQATVMDIARRYQRPQSSTSELLATLVEMGLLYKNVATRSYTLTPRAAILGSLSQPSVVRDGRLLMLAERLRGQTGLGIAIVGMVGLSAQMFLWKPGTTRSGRGLGELSNGQQERLCDTAAGWLLLSSLPQQRAEGVLRRLNAEAPAEAKFCHSELSDRVKDCVRKRSAVGPAGFGANADMCAVLLQSDPNEQPMAVCFIYEASQKPDPATLIATLENAVQNCICEAPAPAASELMVHNAA